MDERRPPCDACGKPVADQCIRPDISRPEWFCVSCFQDLWLLERALDQLDSR